MPTCRRAHFVGDTIRSLLSQSFTDFELLVRDDGKGDDGTEQSVREAASGDPRVEYHRNEKNLRMPGNLNAGIEQTRGELVAVCHDHDFYHPDFLAEYVRLLDRHPTALFAHSGIEMVDLDGKPSGVVHVSGWPELTKGDDWLSTMLASFACPVCALAMVRREAHERFGLYDPTYGFISDIEMWMRLCEHGDVAYAARPLCRVRAREVGHDAQVNPWPLYAIQFAIHRRYAMHGPDSRAKLLRRVLLPLRADVRVLREIAIRIRDGQRVDLGDFVEPLRASAGPLCRALLPIVGSVDGLFAELRS